jgi:hypothetical protein
LKLTNNLTLEDHILKLYALLQSLFVAIDSLYALTYGMLNEKVLSILTIIRN